MRSKAIAVLGTGFHRAELSLSDPCYWQRHIHGCWSCGDSAAIGWSMVVESNRCKAAGCVPSADSSSYTARHWSVRGSPRDLLRRCDERARWCCSLSWMCRSCVVLSLTWAFIQISLANQGSLWFPWLPWNCTLLGRTQKGQCSLDRSQQSSESVRRTMLGMLVYYRTTGESCACSKRGCQVL